MRVKIGFCSSGRFVALRNFVARIVIEIDNGVLPVWRAENQMRKTLARLATMVKFGGEGPQGYGTPWAT